ncbi:MAG: hypothetical protein RLZZ628_1783 [Bacteroidota bacterium]
MELSVITEDNLDLPVIAAIAKASVEVETQLYPVITAITGKVEEPPVITGIAERNVEVETQLYPVITAITGKVEESPVITGIAETSPAVETQLYPVITAITGKVEEPPVITGITDDSELFEEIGDGKYRWKVIQDGNICIHINCVTERVRYSGIEEVKRFIQSYESKINKKMGDLQVNEKWVNYWKGAYAEMERMQQANN